MPFTTITARSAGAKGGSSRAKKMTKKARKEHSRMMLEAKKSRHAMKALVAKREELRALRKKV